MTRKQNGGERPAWLGGAPQQAEAPESPAPFNGGELWIGRHEVDDDTLVFDPAEADPFADPISLYSLGQHRKRSFPRAVALRQIHAVTDEIGRRRARNEYEERVARRREHADIEAAARSGRLEHQRLAVIAAHQRYLEGLGLPYPGVAPTPATHRPGRRSKCHLCGIALDDFAGTICVACNGVLCSCGACACGAAKRPDRIER